MIDPIQPAAFAPAVSVRSEVSPVAPAGHGADTASGGGSGADRRPPAPPAARPDPVSLSVDRDEMGVFVYTLTDSASGRVLAVIPRSAVAAPSQPSEGVDIQA